jgi:hypothetical protein
MNSEDKPEYKPSIEECAKIGRPFIEIPYEPDYALRQLITFFAAKYKSSISKPRLMAISFYTDYRYYQLHREKLTNLSYKPYSYGMYAENITRELDNSPFEETKTWESGTTVPAYKLDKSGLNAVEDDLIEFFEQINNETKKVSTEKLQKFSKNVPMFKNTDYEDVAKFNSENVDSMQSYDL